MKKIICSFALSGFLFLQGTTVSAAREEVHFGKKDQKSGLRVLHSSATAIELEITVSRITLEDVVVGKLTMKSVGLEGILLPNNEGAPNLPGTGRYLAIPEGSHASMEIISMESEIIAGIDVAPAPRIPKETEDMTECMPDPDIYSRDAWYPESPFKLSETGQIRGVDVVMFGYTPFQYNPVSRDLKVYTKIVVRISFSGGQGVFGEQRLRSRWFDPLLQDLLLNPEQLPEVSYDKPGGSLTEDLGYEYLIITPNGMAFQQWADSIREFRTRQGILTGVRTLQDVGGNTPMLLESFINNAYNNWSIPPVAILLLGDYGTNTDSSITSPIWDNYCVSDNILGDVNNDDMPDIIMARITARNAAELSVMVGKFLKYERTPPVSPDFYAHPVTALGWQTSRWFQLCSETVKGFWMNALGKSPVRVNAVYSGNPSTDPWSTATNTSTVVGIFGPGGLNYIPATPQGLGGWTGGTAAMVNNAINSGAFMLLHRDHGYEQGWGEPAYSSSNINSLTNTDLTYVLSVNCLTGKYNYPSEVFAEKFHRYTYNGNYSGAVGVLAASEVSYSFVNDAYLWGFIDNMWPVFLPEYGTTPAHRGILPAFGNAAGKYFLQQSSWPYNTGNKEVTYNLFHHHGDAFLTVYSEVPQNLAVIHDPVIQAGTTGFFISANAGSLICLSLNGEIQGTATGTGSPVLVNIPGNQLPNDQLVVTVTKQNYRRYAGYVNVIAPTGPFVVVESQMLDDTGTGNGNGLLDFGENAGINVSLKNIGIITAPGVSACLHCSDPYITISDSLENFGNIGANAVVSVNNAFTFQASYGIPDGHEVKFTLTCTSGSDIWTSQFSLTAHAPHLIFNSFSLLDPAGNNNGKADPGEEVILQVSIRNTGSAVAGNVMAQLSTQSGYVFLNTNNISYGNISGSATVTMSFSAGISASCPAGHSPEFSLGITAANGVSGLGNFSFTVGQVPVLIVDWDPSGKYSGGIQAAIQANGIASVVMNNLPSVLSPYYALFVCPGIYPGNHVLSASEGQLLANYLQSGKRIYMEGGDTWAYDSATPVHPLFRITGLSDGSGDLFEINGVNGTFTSGMSFNYNGTNNYIDRISPTGGTGAFAILSNASPAYTTGVAYQGTNYKTIGTSHMFSGLNNDSSGSTRNDLMEKYLEFFGMANPLMRPLFTADDTIVPPSAPVHFTDLSAGQPATWQWHFPGGTPSSSTVQNPTVTYSTPGFYPVTLSVSNGFQSHTLTKSAYIKVAHETFNGQLTYDNTAQTPMGSSSALLYAGNSVVQQVPTNSGGFYTFNGVATGDYYLEGTSSKAWGGVNSTDALNIMKHFVQLTPLTGLRLKAADVNASGIVNAVDALAVQKRMVGLITSFQAGDWCFERKAFQFTGQSIPTLNLKGVCFGDVNASYVPASKINSSVVIESRGSIEAIPGTQMVLPVRMGSKADLAAISLFMKFPGNLSLEKVSFPARPELMPVFNLIDGILAISLVTTDPVILGEDDVLLELHLLVKSIPAGDPMELFEIIEGTEFTGLDGNIIPRLPLYMPRFIATTQGFMVNCRPNPFEGKISIEVAMPGEGPLMIRITDIPGKTVRVLADDIFISGNLEFEWDGRNHAGAMMPSGIYIIQVFTPARNMYFRVSKID